MSVEEFPIKSPKKSTNTESIPVQVSLAVSTINQSGTKGCDVGFALVSPIIALEEVH